MPETSRPLLRIVRPSGDELAPLPVDAVASAVPAAAPTAPRLVSSSELGSTLRAEPVRPTLTTAGWARPRGPLPWPVQHVHGQTLTRLQVPCLPGVTRTASERGPQAMARDPHEHGPGPSTGATRAPMISSPWSRALQARRRRPLRESLPPLPAMTAGSWPEEFVAALGDVFGDAFGDFFTWQRRPSPPRLSRHSRRLYGRSDTRPWQRAARWSAGAIFELTLAPLIGLLALVAALPRWAKRRRDGARSRREGRAVADADGPRPASLPAARALPPTRARAPAPPPRQPAPQPGRTA